MCMDALQKQSMPLYTTRSRQIVLIIVLPSSPNSKHVWSFSKAESDRNAQRTRLMRLKIILEGRRYFRRLQVQYTCAKANGRYCYNLRTGPAGRVTCLCGILESLEQSILINFDTSLRLWGWELKVVEAWGKFIIHLLKIIVSASVYEIHN